MLRKRFSNWSCREPFKRRGACGLCSLGGRVAVDLTEFSSMRCIYGVAAPGSFQLVASEVSTRANVPAPARQSAQRNALAAQSPGDDRRATEGRQNRDTGSDGAPHAQHQHSTHSTHSTRSTRSPNTRKTWAWTWTWQSPSALRQIRMPFRCRGCGSGRINRNSECADRTFRARQVARRF